MDIGCGWGNLFGSTFWQRCMYDFAIYVGICTAILALERGWAGGRVAMLVLGSWVMGFILRIAGIVVDDVGTGDCMNSTFKV